MFPFLIFLFTESFMPHIRSLNSLRCLLFMFCLTAAPAFSEPYWLFLEPNPLWKTGDPVPLGIISRANAAGARIRTVSRYFHAVSVEFDGNPKFLGNIPGVRDVRPVRAVRRSPDPGGFPVFPTAKTAGNAEASSYGVMLDEMTALAVPPLHERGLTGKGVMIGVLDTGFSNLTDTGCLKNLRVLHTRNFLRGGSNVSGDRHGSWILACIGGKLEGEYMAPAHGASFLLAVTDDVSTETRADEDRWVAAAEWCDSLGADIISSSLVYNEFDTAAESYVKSQMDGRTSLVARAAEIAASRGILVVNAAGNEGMTPWRIIATPGDAEHVVAVGALSIPAAGEPSIAPFSSVGPTADGRIKPDVVAPGVEVNIPVVGTTGQYMVSSGTSLSAPLIAGLCALLLEARPDWTPAMVMEALKLSARDLGPAGPDNTYGWGLPNGLAALNASPVAVAGNTQNRNESLPAPFSAGIPYPNPFNPYLTIPFRLSSPARVTISVFDISGRLVAVLRDGLIPEGDHESTWNARGCASGVYIVRLSAGVKTEVRKAALVK